MNGKTSTANGPVGGTSGIAGGGPTGYSGPLTGIYVGQQGITGPILAQGCCIQGPVGMTGATGWDGVTLEEKLLIMARGKPHHVGWPEGCPYCGWKEWDMKSYLDECRRNEPRTKGMYSIWVEHEDQHRKQIESIAPAKLAALKVLWAMHAIDGRVEPDTAKILIDQVLDAEDLAVIAARPGT